MWQIIYMKGVIYKVNVLFGCDELTLVLQLRKDIKPLVDSFKWEREAEQIIRTVEIKSSFPSVFGKRSEDIRPPQGYTVAYTYGDHSFYFAVAYHQHEKDMGVCIKFSAQSFAYYCEKTNLNVYKFLKMIKHPFYTMRLSRIDLFVDIIDCDEINITSIYQGFIDKKICVFRETENKKTGLTEYRKVNFTYSGIIRGDEVGTFYLGSVKSPARLRVYDKKTEQIESLGAYFELARDCKSWSRFEGMFRNKYAHQLTEFLLEIDNDQELLNLIASTMIQKFRMMYVSNGVADEDTEFIEIIKSATTYQTCYLQSPSTRNNELLRSILYIYNGSGFVSTIQKINAIWGEKATNSFFDSLYDYAKEADYNLETHYWLRKNLDGYINQYPDFNIYLSKFVFPWMET